MAIKNSGRFSELEFSLSQYFNRHLAPVMASVRSDLLNKQLKEEADYRSSAAGILNAMADASHLVPGLDSSATILKTSGKWNSKTTDDYLDMVRKQIADNKTIQKDIAVLASEWRKAVIDEVGRKAYDNASRQIGADLAYSYIGYRLEEQMLGKMVSDRMPKSSVEYVLRKASERSIFGMSNILKECAADQEINARVEERYKPSTFEKGAVRGTAFAMDVVAMGGVSSWGALAKMAGAEAVFAGLEAYTEGNNKGKEQLSVEECISQGVFGSNANVFTAFRKDAYIPRTWEHPNLIALNRQLSHKLGILESKPMYADSTFLFNPPKPFQPVFSLNFNSQKPTPDKSREGIPFVIAPGKEEEYRESLRQAKKQLSAPKQKPESSMGKAETDSSEHSITASTTSVDSKPATETNTQEVSTADRQADANLSGWDGLLQSFGLDGLSGTGRNLGYVIAMLPDILFGALTGKSKNLGLEDNLIPIASVLAGLFVRNPLLKMTLVGLGGANLLNKAGKEALGSQVQPVHEVQYKQYADEPLNPRIAGVSIQGGALICTIDRVPCTVSLPPATVAAYEAGALPLNTLANAILVRHDAMQEEVALAYQQQYEHAQQQSLSTGIK